MVVAARNKCRTSVHPYRIRITKHTKVIEVAPEHENFSLYTYNAKSFDVVLPRTGNNTLL
jgi:hypothetical protein